MIPRGHGNLFILVLNPNKKVSVILQVPNFSLTTSLRYDIIDINRSLAITILNLQIAIYGVTFLHRLLIVNENAKASESVGVPEVTSADSIVVYVLKVKDGGSWAAWLSLILVFNIQSDICNKLILALLRSKCCCLNSSLLIRDLRHNDYAILQNKWCPKRLPEVKEFFERWKFQVVCVHQLVSWLRILAIIISKLMSFYHTQQSHTWLWELITRVR